MTPFCEKPKCKSPVTHVITIVNNVSGAIMERYHACKEHKQELADLEKEDGWDVKVQVGGQKLRRMVDDD